MHPKVRLVGLLEHNTHPRAGGYTVKILVGEASKLVQRKWNTMIKMSQMTTFRQGYLVIMHNIQSFYIYLFRLILYLIFRLIE